MPNNYYPEAVKKYKAKAYSTAATHRALYISNF